MGLTIILVSVIGTICLIIGTLLTVAGGAELHQSKAGDGLLAFELTRPRRVTWGIWLTSVGIFAALLASVVGALSLL